MLTKDNDTPMRDGSIFEHPVAAATLIYAGAIVVLDSSGNAEKGTTATGKVAIGRCEERADNSAGSAGDITVKVRKGTFKFKNDGSDTIDRADIGGTAWIVDDETVAATDDSSSRSAAGVIRQVDADGVWVDVG